MNRYGTSHCPVFETFIKLLNIECLDGQKLTFYTTQNKHDIIKMT